jgi:hypothetical protein
VERRRQRRAARSGQRRLHQLHRRHPGAPSGLRRRGRPGGPDSARCLWHGVHHRAGNPAAGAGGVPGVRQPERQRRSRPSDRLSDPGRGEDGHAVDRGGDAREPDPGRQRRPHAAGGPRQPHPLRALPHLLGRRAEPLGGGVGGDLPARFQPAPAGHLDERRCRRARHPPRPDPLRRGVRHRCDPPCLPFHRTLRQRLRLPRLAQCGQHHECPPLGRSPPPQGGDQHLRLSPRGAADLPGDEDLRPDRCRQRLRHVHPGGL